MLFHFDRHFCDVYAAPVEKGGDLLSSQGIQTALYYNSMVLLSTLISIHAINHVLNGVNFCYFRWLDTKVVWFPCKIMGGQIR